MEAKDGDKAGMKYLAVIGLCFDIIGVLILAYYGFPSSFLEKKLVRWGFNEEDKEKQRFCSWLGTLLVVLGFVFQIIIYL